MTKYAIFNQKHDCEIWVTLKVGDLESIDTIKELISYELDDSLMTEKGYVESYPFFQADWEIVGGRLDKGFDFNQIIEIKGDL
jgi:hypothetical protein